MNPELEGKTEFRDVSVRGVTNGFIVTGNRRWIDPATSILVAHQSIECVADDVAAATASVGTFLNTGVF